MNPLAIASLLGTLGVLGYVATSDKDARDGIPEGVVDADGRMDFGSWWTAHKRRQAARNGYLSDEE
jgi:hypothetical protein